MAAVYYDEFQSTPATFVDDLLPKILQSSDWSLVPTVYQDTGRDVTSTSAAGGTTVNSSGANATGGDPEGSPIQPGARFVLGRGTATEEIVVVNTTTTNSFTVTAPLANTHVAGENIEWVHDKIVTATTPAGTQLVVNLQERMVASATRQPMAVYRGHAAGVLTDRLSGYLRYHSGTSSGYATTMPIHVLLAVGPDFLYLYAEGPRYGEPGAETYGQLGSAVAVDTVVPYDDTDTNEPVLVAMGRVDSYSYGHDVFVSRDAQDTASWVSARLATMAMPSFNTPNTNIQPRPTRADGTRFFWPWVVCENENGPRGRLKRIYFASMMGVWDTPGQRFTHGPLTYMTTHVIKAAGNVTQSSPWSNLGQYQYNSFVPLVLVPVAGTPA